VSWLEDTLDKDPADPKANVAPKANATREFWSLVDEAFWHRQGRAVVSRDPRA
jgi:hypothetical protein